MPVTFAMHHPSHMKSATPVKLVTAVKPATPIAALSVEAGVQPLGDLVKQLIPKTIGQIDWPKNLLTTANFRCGNNSYFRQ